MVVRAALVLVLALAVALSGCAAGPSTVTTAAAAPFDDCAPVVEPRPTKGVERSPGPAMTYEQAVAAIDRAHRRDHHAATAFTADGRDASRLPQVEHLGSLVGPEALSLDAAVQAADRVLVGRVVATSHGARSTARVRVEVAVRGVRPGEELAVWAGGQVVLPSGRDCLDDAQWLTWGNALGLFAGMRVALLLVPDEVEGHRQLLGVGAYDVTSGQVSAVPRLHPFADEVVGLAEAELLARLRSAAGR